MELDLTRRCRWRVATREGAGIGCQLTRGHEGRWHMAWLGPPQYSHGWTAEDEGAYYLDDPEPEA
jgi:hypothetical protein